MILIDDLGFSHFGCYGSTIATPRIDALARGGLRYTNFHVTPLCSPTRAALLTGRNHHEVGMRSISNFNTGFPNMRGQISPHAATMAEVLRDEGYATFAVGKWHLCQMEQASAAGPFDQWPLQRGFDRYYGFLDGETDQFSPDLVADNHRVDPPASPEDGYHLSEDLVDRAIAMRARHDVDPPGPPVLLLPRLRRDPRAAPGARAPTSRSTAGASTTAGTSRATSGSPASRRSASSPSGTQLAPRNPGVEPWDSLPENHRRLAARLQEAYAGFLEHTDAQIGRLVDALARLGQLDDTLAAAALRQRREPGGRTLRRAARDEVLQLHPRDARRGRRAHRRHRRTAQPHELPVGLGPGRQHAVQVVQAEHPRRRRARPARRALADAASSARRVARLRDQFHHVNDVAPTIYERRRRRPRPTTYRGVAQLPITGTSMRYSLADPDAPSTQEAVQYFEMMGHRALVRSTAGRP